MTGALFLAAALAGTVSSLRRHAQKKSVAASSSAACVDTIMSLGASQDGAVFCCDAATAMLSNSPFMPPEFLIQLAQRTYMEGGCGGPLGQTAEAVRSLNHQYASYDPEDADSSLGVAVHLSDAQTTLMNQTWNMPCEGQCILPPFSGGVCSVAVSLLNKAVSKILPGWKGNETIGRVGLGVCMYPDVTSGGVVYTQRAVDAATRCAYAVDAYSTMRPNKGCGCLQNTFQCFKWPNGTRSGGWGEETDDMVTPCKCESIDQDPTLPNAVGDAKCFWEGERMREGSGQTGIRKAVAQQHKFRETNKKCWNELLLDARVTNRMVQEDAPGAIAAYVIPYPLCMVTKQCRDQVVATRDHVAAEFGSAPIPIVGFNYMNPDEPFLVLDERFS